MQILVLSNGIFLQFELSTRILSSFFSLLFRVEFKWRLQENRFFLVFGLIIHFMAKTPKCPGYQSILNKSRRYRLFSALLRSQFGPFRIPFSWLSEMQCSRVYKNLNWTKNGFFFLNFCGQWSLIACYTLKSRASWLYSTVKFFIFPCFKWLFKKRNTF